MAKIFIYPTTSLILSDMVTRFGHTPLGSAIAIRERVQTAGLESAPLQITPEEPKKGLHWAAVEVPSGVRGRMALYGPMVEQCDAAIIINNADLAFGCMGCARTNELLNSSFGRKICQDSNWNTQEPRTRARSLSRQSNGSLSISEGRNDGPGTHRPALLRRRILRSPA